jgi:hypothetical protein
VSDAARHILTQPKLKDTDMKKEAMAEKKEQPEPNVFERIRAEAKKKQEAERERRARVREFMEKGNIPRSWLQRLNK